MMMIARAQKMVPMLMPALVAGLREWDGVGVCSAVVGVVEGELVGEAIVDDEGVGGEDGEEVGSVDDGGVEVGVVAVDDDVTAL